MIQEGTAARSDADNLCLAGGGEMGARMRAFDWAAAPVGPVEGWPQSLRTALSILLASGYPMYVAWGPEFVQFYNDAYRPILGATKHPAALGQSTRECFAEIWHIIGPMFERVMTEGEASSYHDYLLPLDRNGYLEECYFDFSYSAVRDETGGMGGVFVTCSETTGRVLGERRLHTLRDLAARAGQARSAEEACAVAAETLATNPSDLPFALLYLLTPDGTTARLAAAAGIAPGGPAAPESVALSQREAAAATWPLGQVARTGQAGVVEDLAARFGTLPGGPWPESPTTALILPLSAPGQAQLAGILVAGVSPRRTVDAEYRSFLELVAQQVETAITHARAYDAERQRAEALAELDRAKTAFFSNVSHEFRTPLTLLLGPLEDVLARADGALAARDREDLQVVQRNGLRLLRLVNTLLDFSRIEAGRIEAVYEPTDLAAFTAELASVFRSAIERAGLRLIVDCPPLPEPVYVDREMWEKIVLNLLSNAFKYTLRGEIGVRLQADATAVTLAVEDTGTGIPADELPRIFERFHRVQDARGRTHEGTGIGLALVQELVRLHGGSIAAESTYGEGSRFVVSISRGTAHLPADRIQAGRTLASTALGAIPFIEEALRWLPNGASSAVTPAVLGTAWAPPVAAADHSATSGAGAEARILLADDNADMREYVRRLLSQRWQVEAVADGAAALAATRARVPDLVLADVMMPGLDGFELLRALRADPRTREVPVILLSARAGEESRVEGLDAGADDYLVKPFAARELLARVGVHLTMARLRTAAAARERAARTAAEQAQQAAEAAATRLAGLQALTGALSRTMNAAEVAEQVFARTLPLFGAVGGDLRRRGPDGTESHVGWAHDAASPPTVPGVAATPGVLEAALDVNAALFLGSRAEWERACPEDAPFLGAHGYAACAALPLTVEGRRLGALGVYWREAPAFSPDDRHLLQAIAHQCAQALERVYLYEQAQDAIRVRDEFLAAAAHDLRNPLAAVKGQAQLLQRHAAREAALSSERVARSALQIDAALTRMSALIDELLDVARLQIGQPLELQRHPVELVALAQRVADECQQTTDAHRLQVESADTVLCGLWDSVRLERVLTNLVANAIHYSPAGGEIVVRLARAEADDRAWALVQVEDHGIGIPADELPRVFDRFYRGRNTRGRISGTGIGLAGARQIIEQHGGTITVTSAEGVGSTFTVRLPLHEALLASAAG